jgi:DNA-directed RNA polymerase subunit RPC12/RpoP
MNKTPVKMHCPRCGHFLGATVGPVFESMPCPNCRWRVVAWRGEGRPPPPPQSFRKAVEIKA